MSCHNTKKDCRHALAELSSRPERSGLVRPFPALSARDYYSFIGETNATARSDYDSRFTIRTHAMSDELWMRQALALAVEAAAGGDVPVGAVVVRGAQIVAAAGNRTVRDQDPTAHAELLAIREAARVGRDWRLTGCTLYVTLEPCAMCAGAIVLARLDRVVFGAFDDKAGMVGSVGDILRHPRLNHRPQVQAGILATETGALLAEFFKSRR
jgi:tRNA(adenine34) deaminase